MICTINSASKPIAQISVNKNIQKVYDGKIYLENGTEFQLMFFNPTQKRILAKIYLNDELISFSGLVIRPGERVWLDRFIDQPKKFKFETYQADNSPEGIKAIEKNGRVKIDFFRESSPKQLLCDNYGGWFSTTNPNWVNPWVQNTPWVGTPFYDTTGIYYDENIGTAKNHTKSLSQTKETIETGRIEEGKKSDQTFQTIHAEFDFFAFETVNYQILPISKKDFFTASDLKRKCSKCGKKIKSDKAIYCSNCGTKL